MTAWNHHLWRQLVLPVQNDGPVRKVTSRDIYLYVWELKGTVANALVFTQLLHPFHCLHPLLCKSWRKGVANMMVKESEAQLLRQARQDKLVVLFGNWTRLRSKMYGACSQLPLFHSVSIALSASFPAVVKQSTCSSVAFTHTTGTSHLHFCCVHHALPPLNMHKGCYNTSVTHLTRNSKLHSPFFKLLSQCVPTNLRLFSLLNQPFPSLCIGRQRCSGHERSHHQNSLSLIRLPFPPLL